MSDLYSTSKEHQDRYSNSHISGCLNTGIAISGEISPLTNNFSGWRLPKESSDPTLNSKYRNLFGTMENPRPIKSTAEIVEQKHTESLPPLSNCVANFNDAIKNLQEIREQKKPKPAHLTLWQIIWQFIRVVILGKQPA